MEYYLITFSSTHAAIAAQKYFAGICKIIIMPTLREISNSCGISIRIEKPDLAKAAEALRIFRQTEPSPIQIYHVTPKSIQKWDGD